MSIIDKLIATLGMILILISIVQKHMAESETDYLHTIHTALVGIALLVASAIH